LSFIIFSLIGTVFEATQTIKRLIPFSEYYDSLIGIPLDSCNSFTIRAMNVFDTSSGVNSLHYESCPTIQALELPSMDASFDIEYIYLLIINPLVQPVAGQSPGAPESSPPPVVHLFLLLLPPFR
jgi:hypothetical protein